VSDISSSRTPISRSSADSVTDPCSRLTAAWPPSTPTSQCWCRPG